MTCDTESSQCDLATTLCIEHFFAGIANAVDLLNNRAIQIERSRYAGAYSFIYIDARYGESTPRVEPFNKA